MSDLTLTYHVRNGDLLHVKSVVDGKTFHERDAKDQQSWLHKFISIAGSGVSVKAGRSNQFKDKVEVNSAMKSGREPKVKVQQRRGYVAVIFDYGA